MRMSTEQLYTFSKTIHEPAKINEIEAKVHVLHADGFFIESNSI